MIEQPPTEAPTAPDPLADALLQAPIVAPGPRRLLEMIGGTPMIDLSDLVGRPGVRLLGKAEFANPGGSVKDRPALAMMLEARHRLGPQLGGRRVLDATSGNAGIALAMVSAAFGLPITLCMTAKASLERKQLLRAYGAQVVLTDPVEGSDGAIREARRLQAEAPEKYAYLDQYSNPENWRAHYRTTGPEIWQQTAGQLTHFITGIGTSGTMMGVGRFLRKHAPQVRLISVQPDSPLHGIDGYKHMASAMVPEIYDAQLVDEAWTTSTETGYDMVKQLARRHGLLVGVSAGANVAAALRLAEQLEQGTVVTVLCDNADKYLSEPFWEEP